MTMPPVDNQPLWPLAVYFAAIVAIIAAMLGLSYVLGQRHRERATVEPYESGISTTGTARVRFDIKFYLVAVFFLIFDLEAASLPPRLPISGGLALWTGGKENRRGDKGKEPH
jgi:NADH-quinone oxidoreductase subunit A